MAQNQRMNKCVQINIMGSLLDLTIQVLNLSPRVTLADLNSFFSYCGTVQSLQIPRNINKEQSTRECSALVTFTHPFAFQTALLLDDAVLADKPIRILPARDSAIPISSDDDDEATIETRQGRR